MKVTVIPIVIGVLGTVTKESPENGGPGDEDEYCWYRSEYWDESRRLEEICCHSNFSEKASANTGVKDSEKSKIMIRNDRFYRVTTTIMRVQSVKRKSDWAFTIRMKISFEIIIIIIIIHSLELFTSALADGFSQESEWQQVSSSLQDSSLYSGSFQQCCRLDGLHSSANFQVLQSL